jgi:radical SAM superfamily enzyme YgiQ (UPF0313 family)
MPPRPPGTQDNRIASTGALVVNPAVQVSWLDGRIRVTVPQKGSAITSANPRLLDLLQLFSRPTTLAQARAELTKVAPTDFASIVRRLCTFGVLTPVGAGRSRSNQIRIAADRGRAHRDASGPISVLFVVPVDLVNGFGACSAPHPTGLYLANLARRSGHDFRFVGDEPPSEAPLEALQRQAQVVLAAVEEVGRHGKRPVLGLSCFSSVLYQPTMLLAALVRAAYPKLPILVGGHHATIAPQSLLTFIGSEIPTIDGAHEPSAGGAALLEQIRRASRLIRRRGDHVFDYVFSGHAERSFPSILDRLRTRYRRPSRLVLVPPSPCSARETRQFRYAPEVFEALDLAGKGIDSIGLCLSLGCPEHCAFCIQSANAEPWRAVESAHAVETLGFLHDHCGVRHVALGDANFACSPTWGQQFFTKLAEQKWASSLSLDCETSVLRFGGVDPALLKQLDVRLQIGVETASEDMLKRMGKAQEPEIYLAKLERLISEVSPHVTSMVLMLILGFPGETRKTLLETFQFLYARCRIHEYPNISVLGQVYLPLMGSEAVQKAAMYEQDGFRSSRLDWWLGPFEARHAGLRPSHDLSLEYCQAISDRLASDDGRKLEWPRNAGARRRADLARWLTNPLVSVQSGRVSTFETAQLVLARVRHAATAFDAHDGGTKLAPAAFRAVAEKAAGPALVEWSGPTFVGCGDRLPTLAPEILSLASNEVLATPLAPATGSGYFVCQRVE